MCAAATAASGENASELHDSPVQIESKPSVSTAARELDELAAGRRLRGPVAELEPELQVVGHAARRRTRCAAAVGAPARPPG